LAKNNRVELKKALNDSLEKELVGFLNYYESGEIFIRTADDGMVTGVVL